MTEKAPQIHLKGRRKIINYHNKMIEIIKLSATEHIYKEMIDCILCSSIKPPPPSGSKGHVDTDRKSQRLKSLMNKITIVLYVLMFCLN